MEKRYQVFVSSTYQDLIEERIEVIQALLELDCIPCGMEYFPAADETQWDFIKKLIDESDYYLVVIAGKYGSMDENGVSYTQKEYEYAVSKNIPTIAFLHKDIDTLIASKVEKDGKKRKKLEDFKDVVKKKLCKYWTTPQELGAVVSRSMSQAKKNYPRIGWIRADFIDENSQKEILQLYKRIETLEKEIEVNTNFKSPLTEVFADLTDEVTLNVEVMSGPYNKRTIERKEIKSTWNDIQYHLLPKLIQPIKELSLRQYLNGICKEIFISQNKVETYTKSFNVSITNESVDTIKVQFQALGLIKFYSIDKENAYSKSETKIVALTQKGETRLIEIRAIKKT